MPMWLLSGAFFPPPAWSLQADWGQRLLAGVMWANPSDLRRGRAAAVDVLTMSRPRFPPARRRWRWLAGHAWFCGSDVRPGLEDRRAAHDRRFAMNSWAVRGWLLLAALLALAYGGWISYGLERDEPLSTLQAATPERISIAENLDKNPRPIRDFSLTDQTGQPFGTSDLRGQVWVASFFFASCAGTCRQLNFALARRPGASARGCAAGQHHVRSRKTTRPKRSHGMPNYSRPIPRAGNS